MCFVDNQLFACSREGVCFVPLAVESLGAWHKTGVAQIKKLGSAKARHTGEEEGQEISRLFQKLSIALMRGNSALLNNRRRRRRVKLGHCASLFAPSSPCRRTTWSMAIFGQYQVYQHFFSSCIRSVNFIAPQRNKHSPNYLPKKGVNPIFLSVIFKNYTKGYNQL